MVAKKGSSDKLVKKGLSAEIIFELRPGQSKEMSQYGRLYDQKYVVPTVHPRRD